MASHERSVLFPLKDQNGANEDPGIDHGATEPQLVARLPEFRRIEETEDRTAVFNVYAGDNGIASEEKRGDVEITGSPISVVVCASHSFER